MAIGVALLVAGLALVLAVLPAEFGVDPLGIGRKLGLLALAESKAQVAAFEGTRDAAATARTVAQEPRAFRTETVDFALAPHEFVEYKYRLDKGQPLLYSWNATAPVNLRVPRRAGWGAARLRRDATRSATASRARRARSPRRSPVSTAGIGRTRQTLM